jgi:GTP-binding protein EngB required for normal cell division
MSKQSNVININGLKRTTSAYLANKEPRQRLLALSIKSSVTDINIFEYRRLRNELKELVEIIAYKIDKIESTLTFKQYRRASKQSSYFDKARTYKTVSQNKKVHALADQILLIEPTFKELQSKKNNYYSKLA